jgi:hypothetical protein
LRASWVKAAKTANTATAASLAVLLCVHNDAVIVQIGGTPPSVLLATFGIKTVEKRGEA